MCEINLFEARYCENRLCDTRPRADRCETRPRATQGEALLIFDEVTASQNIMVIMVHWSPGITKEHGNTIIFININTIL